MSDYKIEAHNAKEPTSVCVANILELHERVVASLETLDGGGGKELAKNSAENLVNNIDKVEVLSDNDKKGRLLD